MLEIESGVPLIERRSPHTDAVWQAMQRCAVGDSFFVPRSKRWAGSFVSRNQGKISESHRFSVRGEGSGCRIWRTA